jgi:alpha-galactosidase
MIGAGNSWGTQLSVDILGYEALRQGEIALVDLVPARAKNVAAYAQRAVAQHGCKVKITGATDRKKVLKGADFVIMSYHVGGPAYSGKPYYYDIEIPNKYGIPQQVGDTIGPGGVIRFLRTVPVMTEMLRDIEKLAPNACVINYVNPMSMLTWAATNASCLPFIGLCHSVQGGAWDLAKLAGIPVEQLRYTCAGINHMGWFIEAKQGTRDLYPKIKKAAVADKKFYAQNRTRVELMLQFGAYPAEGPSHHSEYYPYFRSSKSKQRHYGLKGAKQVDPKGKGYHATYFQDPKMQAILKGDAPIDLKPSNEYASTIINSIVTGRPSRIYGNVPNAGGLIHNLPLDCIVEVPCLVDENGWHGCAVGPLPSQLAALNLAHINVHRLAVEAWQEKSREKAIHAIMLDPLTAAVCTMDDARAMANELLDSQPEHLGYLK